MWRPLQPEKSDTHNPETAANFAKTNCAWSDLLRARAYRHQRRHPLCSLSRYMAARRNFRMKTRRCVCLWSHNDHTSVPADLQPKHRHTLSPAERARREPSRRPDRNWSAFQFLERAARTYRNDATRVTRARAGAIRGSEKVASNSRGLIRSIHRKP